tara:strand:- start:1597 stop:2118 length:522 start_codon:yes stop_codon:yes gene_type:complete
MTNNIQIPNRAYFKSAEVCAITKIQPYVLKSWEAEFPTLGGTKTKDGSKVYTQADLKLILEIKDLLFRDGLTLGAARRQIDAQRTESDTKIPDLVVTEASGQETRKTLMAIKQELQDMLVMLSGDSQNTAGQLELGESILQSQAPAKSRTRKRASQSGVKKDKPAARRTRRTA